MVSRTTGLNRMSWGAMCSASRSWRTASASRRCWVQAQARSRWSWARRPIRPGGRSAGSTWWDSRRASPASPSSAATETAWMATLVGPNAVQAWLPSWPRRVGELLGLVEPVECGVAVGAAGGDHGGQQEQGAAEAEQVGACRRRGRPRGWRPCRRRALRLLRLVRCRGGRRRLRGRRGPRSSPEAPGRAAMVAARSAARAASRLSPIRCRIFAATTYSDT